MEQTLVQVMAVAVVAEVEPKHVKAVIEQARRGVTHVAGLAAAFPAMQQQDQAARLASENLAVDAEQAHTASDFDDVFAGARTRALQQALAEQAAQGCGADQRLQVRIAQPAWNTAPQQYSMQPPKTSSKTWIWVLLILGVVVIACGGGIVGFVFMVEFRERVIEAIKSAYQKDHSLSYFVLKCVN